jgi:hypothetical protein
MREEVRLLRAPRPLAWFFELLIARRRRLDEAARRLPVPAEAAPAPGEVHTREMKTFFAYVATSHPRKSPGFRARHVFVTIETRSGYTLECGWFRRLIYHAAVGTAATELSADLGLQPEQCPALDVQHDERKPDHYRRDGASQQRRLG